MGKYVAHSPLRRAPPQNRLAEARPLLAQIFGEKAVDVKLSQIQRSQQQDKNSQQGDSASASEGSGWSAVKEVFGPKYRRQLIVGTIVSASQQLTGINVSIISPQRLSFITSGGVLFVGTVPDLSVLSKSFCVSLQNVQIRSSLIL